LSWWQKLQSGIKSVGKFLLVHVGGILSVGTGYAAYIATIAAKYAVNVALAGKTIYDNKGKSDNASIEITYKAIG